MGRAEPGVRRRGARARECERPGGWERALEILLASLRGGQEAGAGAQGNAGTLPRTSARARTRPPSSLLLPPSRSRALWNGNRSRSGKRSGGEPGMRPRNRAARGLRARNGECGQTWTLRRGRDRRTQAGS